MNENFGYNLQSGGSVNRTVSESTRVKLSKENKKGASCRNFPTGINHHLYGKHLSDDTKEKLRQYHLGMKASDETKIKMSEQRKGSKNARCVTVYCPELDESFWGAKEAQDKYGVNRNKISERCCCRK